MKSFITKTVCMVLMVVLCIGSLSAQSPTGKLVAGPKKTVKTERTELKLQQISREVILSEGFESGAIPDGWTAINTGTGAAWQIVDGLYSGTTQVMWPHSGNYFATNLYSSMGTRNAWLFSKGMTLTAGTTYNISFWLSLAGFPSWDEYDYFEAKIGQSATAAGMTTELYRNTDTYVPNWTKMESTFTPTTSGTYYLGFHAFSPYDEGNDIDLDDIEVSVSGSTPPPSSYEPPLNVQATVVNTDNVNVSWVNPNVSYEGWITYATSGVTGRVGYSETEGANMIAAIRYTPEDMANLLIKNGSILSKVQLGMGKDLSNINTMEVKIWQGATSMTNPGTEVCTQVVSNPGSLAEEEWNEITLTTPVTIDVTKELWIGYRVVNTAGYPLGRDSGPVVTGKGELISINGTWSTNSSYNILYNWCIQGYVTNAKGEPIELSHCGVNDKGRANRAVIKRYNVFCDGAFVGNTAATSFTHTNVPYGTHEYCVSATYAGNIESDQACAQPVTLANPNPPTWTCATGPSFPYSEGFNAVTIPSCWTQQNVVGTTNWTFVTATTGTPNTAHSGTHKARLYYNSSGGGRGATTKLISPVLNLGCATEATLSFWHTQQTWTGDQDELRVYYRTSSTGAWTLIPGAEYTTSVSTWTQRTLSLPNINSTYYIAFEGKIDYGYGVQLDDVSISTGGLPVAGTNPGATNVQATMPHIPDWYTVNLSWTAPTVTTNLIGYNVYRDGFLVSGNTPVSGTTFTDVAPYAGSYTYAVEALWEGGCPSVRATTTINMEISPCATPIISFPYKQGFENNGTNLPMCWTQQQVKGDSLWRIVPANYGRPNTSHTGIYKAMYRGWNVVEQAAKLITPSINLSSGDASLSFWYTNEAWLDGQDHLRVYYRTSSTGEWVLLQSFNESVNAWTQVTIELPNPTADYSIAFEGDTHYGYGIFLDDIQVDGCAILDELPYAEGFETSFPNFPGCWTQTQITGTTTWKVTAANGGGSPSTTHGGSYKALFYAGTSAANVNRLEGPVFELGSLYDYIQFSFWHTQASWLGDIDNLRVYTQASADGDWTKIAEYTDAVAAWTQRTFDVNVSSYFRFGFEATNDFGYGVHLDDIKIVGCNKIKQFPWTESFALTGVANNTILAMDCWINDGLRPGNPTTTPDAPWKFFSAMGTYPSAPLRPGSTGGMIQFNSFTYRAGAKGTLTTPPIVSPTGEKYLEVSFWMYRDAGSSSASYATEGVNLYITSTKDITGATPSLFVPRASTFAPTATANTWNKYSVIIDPATAGTFYITLEGVSAYGNNIYVDDLTVQPYECTPQDLNIVESFEDPSFFPPVCWINDGGTTNTPWKKVTAGTYPTCTPQDGGSMIQFNSFSSPYTSGRTGQLTTRGFNTNGKNQLLSFWMYRDAGYATSADRVAIYVGSTTSITGLTPIFTVNRAKTLAPVETGADGWYQYFVSLPCASMPVAYVTFQGISAYGNNMYVDNIQIGDLCIPPTNVQAVAFGDDPVYPNHATITWEAPTIIQASLTGYRVFRNGTQIANNLTALTYTDNTNLAPGEYEYCVAGIYSNACGVSTQVCATKTVIVQPCPTAPVPANATATKHVDDWYDVDLSWTDPTLKANLSYAKSGPQGAIGASGDFSIAVRFTPADLTACTGGVLSGVTFAPSETGINYVIKICQGGGDFTPGTQVYTQTVPASALQIGASGTYILNTVTLTSPVTIDVTKDLWIQIDFVGSTAYPAGRDSGPVAKEGYSNLTYFDGAWTTAYQLNSALTYNWCLSGKVTAPNANPVLGYNVYDKEGNKLTIPQLPESANTYRVTVPGQGAYQYGVTALYAGTFCESPKAMINFDMELSPCESPWAVPIVESFDGEKFAPWCWETRPGDPAYATPWKRVTTGTYPACQPHSGAAMIQYNSFSSPYTSGRTGLMITPFFATENDYTLKFWMYRDNGYLTSADRVNVYLSATTSITGLTPLLTVNRSINLAPAVTANGWYEYIVQLSTSGMNGAYVIFEGVSGYGNNIYVDDIVILDERACDPIQNLAVTQPKEGEVHFTWEPPLPTGFTGVKVIRDGLIVAPMITDLFYTDYTSVGTHNYCFIALYDKPECTQALPVCFDVNVISQCDPVSEVTATVIGDHKVRVNWTTVTALGFDKYMLYRDGDLLIETTQTVYIDEEVEEPGIHEYSVVVKYNKDCAMSDPTISNKIFIESCAEVINLQAAASAEAVVLTWEHPDVAKANRDVIYSTDFEELPDGTTYGGPEGWTIIDADGDGENWYGLKNAGSPIIPGHSGTGLMTSASWVGYPLNPNNYLITPLVEGASSVTYWVCNQDAYSEYYGVCASTTGNAVGDFTLVFEEQLAMKDQTTWYERTVELPAGTKYIAWRHFNISDAFRLNLDDVTVMGGGVAPAEISFNVYKDATFLANVTEPTYTDTDISEGATYVYCVKPVYEFCQVEPACSTVNIPRCVPVDVTDVLATGNKADTTAYITWEYAGEGATFDIYRDNVKIANTSEMSYTDKIQYNVIYKYCVTPIDMSCPGGASACDTVLINHVGIAEGDLEGFSIFPNPASSHVTVKGKNIVQIDIYNAIGQMVETMKVAEGESASTTVDVSTYEPGTYIFKVHGADKAIITKPIVVSRH